MTEPRTLRRVLVTGAAGFIGAHLAARLAECGATVIAVDRRAFGDMPKRSADQAAGVVRITADLRDCALEPLLLEADTVFHLAAQPGVRTSWASGFADYLADNLFVTHRLTEASARLGVSRFVLASSSSVYGPTAGQPSREADQTSPISPYAISKLAAELLCAAHCGQAGRLTETVALRYFTVYGPGQRRDMLIHRALNAALSREPVRIYGSGGQQRDFTFIDDAVSATVAAATCFDPPQVVNVGSGYSVKLDELFATIAEVTGTTVPTTTAPIEPGDVQVTLADTTLARHYLGWQPATTLSDGIAAQWEWLQSSCRTVAT